jgi:CRISPR-associated protein Csx17
MTTTEATAASRTRHALPGLRPQPLASYLAGLGLFRLIGEQADATATAEWAPDGLVIETTIPDLAEWLTDRYEPTPVLSPWNGGSGFGPAGVKPGSRLEQLLSCASPRLASYKSAYEATSVAMRRAHAAGWINASGKFADKQRFVQELRNRCPGPLLPWIDASVVLTANATYFPPLLGTGGNDGRLEFSKNLHEHLMTVLEDTPGGRMRSLRCAVDLLTGVQQESLAQASAGQFDPAGTGGRASSPYGAGTALINPWQFVLLMEGTLVFASGAARRNQDAASRAAIPFTVESSPDLSDSGAAGEESRGEVWVPVWSRPFTFSEVRQLFGEARASWRGRPARRAVDFYAATRALGVAAGIDEFVRYGIQQRNGQAFVAVALDRVKVVDKARQVRLIGGMEDWASWIPRGETTRAVGTSLRAFDTALLRYVRAPDAVPLRDLLAALTSLELAVGRSGGTREKVQPRLVPDATEFLKVMKAAQCPELRIAAGLASCATLSGAGGLAARTMRQILLPLDPGSSAQRPGSGRWRDAPLVPGFGARPLQRVMADVLAWRSRTAAAESSGGRPEAADFRGVPTFRLGVSVPAADLHAWARGDLDTAELDKWFRACLALRWRPADPGRDAPGPAIPVPLLALLHPLAAGLREAGNGAAPPLALGPDWAVRLGAGQLSSVHADAARRLRQAGWQAVPAIAGQPSSIEAGVAVAAALVPRCSCAEKQLRMFARLIRDDSDPAAGQAKPGPADVSSPDNNEERP